MPVFKLSISVHGSCEAYIKAEDEAGARAVFEDGEWRHTSHPFEWEEHDLDLIEEVPDGDYPNMVETDEGEED
jgi:hypothetical protein